MKSLFVLFLVAITSLGAVGVGPWQNIRYTNRQNAANFQLRTEITQGAHLVNRVLYGSASAIAEANFSLYNPATSTYQATIPGANPRKYLGLKQSGSDGYATLVPVYYDGTGLPGIANLTPLSTDPANDTATNYLDIVADYVSFSDTKLYGAIKNRGGGFPTGNLFGPFYAYMVIIADPTADPDDPNTIAWAMVRISAGLGLYSTGLYKTQGTSTSSLQRVGNIESTIVTAQNLLVMSCNWSDLLSDPDFTAWYNQNPRIGIISATLTVTMSMVVTQNDNSLGGYVYAQKLFQEMVSPSTQQISNNGFVIAPNQIYYTADYYSPTGLYPQALDLTMQNGTVIPLAEQSINYGQTVNYRSANLYNTLGEYNDHNIRVRMMVDSSTEYFYPWQQFSYITALGSPPNVQATIAEDNLILSWDHVTHSAAGTPITVSDYRIEFSENQDFQNFSVQGHTNTNQISFPLNTLSRWRFFRIIAVKNIP
ncbi:MAG: hypothetical protein U1C33_04140, partial [Candidatus Cloacimonadaceae bacterium]|nr:hypothetical protein [Candidatus Cloacimonadaceae bacterium]